MLKLLFLVFLLFAAAPVLACSCRSPGLPDEAYARASAVFTANIEVTKRFGSGQGSEFRFTRGKSWKGDAPPEFIVSPGACPLENVQSGAEYLVYAGEDLQVSMCSRMKLLKQARLEAQYLDALQAGRKVDLAAGLPEMLAGAQDEDRRAEAAELLGETMRYDMTGNIPASFVPALAQGARDRSVAVRLAAVRALGNYPANGRTAALVAALQDADRGVRAAAVTAAVVGANGDGALFPALTAALKKARADPNPDREAQEDLLHTFSRALPRAATTEAEKQEVVKLLQGLIDEIKEPWRRVAAVQQLGFMRTRATEAVPQLLQVLKTADYYSLKQYTIIALGDLGAAELQAEIEPYLKDQDCSVAQAVVQAVWKMNQAGFGKFFVEKGMPEMQARFDSCSWQFIYGLQAIAPAGREMAPFLTRKYEAMADADSAKSTLKTLLDAWKAAP